MLMIVMLIVMIIMTMIIIMFNPVVNNTPNEGNGLTALEVWVLSNIGLVFLAFLAYALLLAKMKLHPFRDVAPQKNQMSPTKDQNAKERGLGMFEIRLFFSVILATLVFAIVFFAYYVI